MRTFCLMSLALLPGCGMTSYGGPQPTIHDGSAPDRPEHRAVVALHQYGYSGVATEPFCSGTLVDRDLVLTAAHCLDGFEPEDIAVYVGDDPSAPTDTGHDVDDHHYEVTEIHIHPEWDAYALLNDVGVIRLATTPDETDVRIGPLPADLQLTEADVGVTLDVVGFGYTEGREFGDKLHVEVPMAGFGCGHSSCGSWGDPDTQIWFSKYWDGGQGGACNGDSGGPWFVTRDGEVYVAGITSYGYAGCDRYAVGTHAAMFWGFLDDYVDEAPSAPGRVVINELMADPGGQDRGAEWVELVNVGDGPVDLSDWRLADGFTERHVFEPYVLGPHEVLVVRDEGIEPIDSEVVASTGYLYLNNGGDTLTLFDAQGDVHDAVSYAQAHQGRSLNRTTDGDPQAPLADHDTVPQAAGAWSSPHTRVDGTAF